MRAGQKRSKSKIVLISEAMTGAISSIRSLQVKNSFSGPAKNEVSRTISQSSAEILQLGRLFYRWGEIVGPDLCKYTFPKRLIKGKLFLVCSDSQCLHNFMFLKEKIIVQIETFFPNLKISEIQANVGKVLKSFQPVEKKVWPDWRQEDCKALPQGVSPDFAVLIDRCRKKLQARKKGLSQEGYVPCPDCGAILVPIGVAHCSVCLFRLTREKIGRMRFFLEETPWLSFSEIQELLPGASLVEFDLIRNELLTEESEKIRQLSKSYYEIPDENLITEITKEIIRAVIFKTGLTPDLINLYDPSQQTLLDSDWVKILNIFREDTCSLV